MKLSFDWLADYVDLSGLSPQEVADRLTMGSFEVEELHKVGPDVQGPLVVGEILQINPHPNADKIRLTKVRVDSVSEPLDIVCGAPNIIVGQRVPVALPGARVIDRHNGTDLHIKKSKIRGETSNGMLCSAAELGIAAEGEDGILTLYGQPEPGTDVIELLRLRPDFILHVEPRSNRGDAMSVVGLAREVAALFGREMRHPNWKLPDEDETSTTIEISIENLCDCPFFSLRTLQDLHVGPSPLYILRRLQAIGVRPVNNIVDITNYVLHELGQPLHAYDLDKLTSRQFQVRRAVKGEQLITLDGRTRELSDDILLIAEPGRAVGIAGVMGGQDTEIDQSTSFVVLEAAAFEPSRVRRSSRLLGLHSDSSLRFERGVDIATVKQASDRASCLIVQHAGAIMGKMSTAGSDRTTQVSVPLRLSQVQRLLELELNGDQVQGLLQPLGFQVETTAGDTLAVAVPSFRQRDVTREIDVIEEVCRLWGYDRIVASMPRATSAPESPDDTEEVVRRSLCASGLSEAILSSLVPRFDYLETASENLRVEMLNPLSEEHQVMRQSLLPGLIRAVKYNHDHGQKDVWLFEIGRTYERKGPSSEKDPGVQEYTHVAGLLSGTRALSSWQTGGQAADFYQAKGVVENLFLSLKLDLDAIEFSTAPEAPPVFHPKRACTLVHGTQLPRATLGVLAQIHPQVADRVGLRVPCYGFEFNLDLLRSLRGQPHFSEIFNSPITARDLTVDLDQGIEQQVVQRCIRESGGKLLRTIELVSVFQLSESTKSYSYRLLFQHHAQTLTQEELETILEGIRQSLTERLKATFRM